MKDTFTQIKSYIVFVGLFLFPFFFLPFTQEFFITNKLYLISFLAIVLILVSIIEFAMTKKIVWHKGFFDNGLFLFLLTIGLSIIIASPNKIQAILSPSFGFLGIFSLVVLYLYIVRLPKTNKFGLTPFNVLSVSSVILSIITIVFFFSPLKKVALSADWQIFKASGFTTMGSQLDLAIFLGFFTLMGISRILKPLSEDKAKVTFDFVFSTVNLTALLLTIYFILKSTAASVMLPPMKISWFAAVETLKNPITALFGVGLDNFAAIFAKVKDLGYNQSPLWQVNSFNVGRSALLQVFTEAGAFGLIAFALLLIGLYRSVRSFKENQGNSLLVFGTIYLISMLLFFPPSLSLFFLFFVSLGIVAQKISHTHIGAEKQGGFSLDLSEIVPVYLGVIFITFVFIGGSGFLLYKSYIAEYYFKQSLTGLLKNSAKDLYDNQRQAIMADPYIERFRINFSQTNLLIANNLASKSKDTITDQDKQMITQAIQTAIAEGKAAVTLNAQKGANWINLAEIYRNIFNVVQGADSWTISSYQRAIISDPQNPVYRLNLGGIYYSLKNYEEAGKLFEQAVFTKPDWPNAYYNLAWADFQRGNFQRAVGEMQSVLNLVDPRSAKADYEKAKADLAEFKKKLPEATESAVETTEKPKLGVPTPPVATFSPKLKLPKEQEASPEAE